MTRRHTTSIGRVVATVALATLLLLVAAPAAFAHSEFDLTEVAPGSIVTLQLFVENESSTAGTTQVELRFPIPLVVVDLPGVEGWTATPVEGEIGGEAIGVLWTRPTADPSEDPNLPLTIGPLPDREGRLQFKVLQTYSDGEVGAWIDDWPVGAEEPDRPGPIVDLVAGAPGTIPDTTIAAPTTAEGLDATVTTESAAVTTTSPATSTPPKTATPTTAATPPTTATSSTTTAPPTASLASASTNTGTSPTTEPAGTDDSKTGVIVGVVLGLILAAAAGVVWMRQNRR